MQPTSWVNWIATDGRRPVESPARLVSLIESATSIASGAIDD
ncbi:hypothetical protein [Micromonospora sp. L5]|nr:hypothetical protein [Micromonospora sp. L5]